MKTIIFSILTVLCSLAFAGGSGGGGVMMSTGKVIQFENNGQGNMKQIIGLKSEIIFKMGKQNGLVKFAYGQLVDNQWQIQKIEIAEAELIANASVFKALQDSETLNDWAELK